MYRIIYTDDALKDLKLLQKKAPSIIQKLKRLLAEIQENPRLGTGKAERLKGYAIETWSRRISQEHRLVYEIHENIIAVIVISAYGHYK